VCKKPGPVLFTRSPTPSNFVRYLSTGQAERTKRRLWRKFAARSHVEPCYGRCIGRPASKSSFAISLILFEDTSEAVCLPLQRRIVGELYCQGNRNLESSEILLRILRLTYFRMHWVLLNLLKMYFIVDQMTRCR
jgi:hypothetical protein